MVSVYTLASPLHDAAFVRAAVDESLSALGVAYAFATDWSSYGREGLPVIFICTGGTEGLFAEKWDALPKDRPVLLFASGKNNSLPASMEILSFLQARGQDGEILHGSPERVGARIRELARLEEARRRLRGMRLGLIGRPSDWLIASDWDASALREGLGLELVEIPMSELLDAVEALPLRTPAAGERAAMPGAERIYEALKILVARHRLSGFTLRCFDLLDTVRNTGCLALARLNAEGVVAGCEGDVPTLVSMCICSALTGVSGFQANPSRIDPERGEVVFAHCTVPLDMVASYDYDTHFESGIGVGIRGRFAEGPVTVFKLSGDLKRCFIGEGTLCASLSEKNLCRTQIRVRLDHADAFLKHPVGNHHVIVPGHVASLLQALCRSGRRPCDTL